MNKIAIISFLSCFFYFVGIAQSTSQIFSLAHQYYKDGEYEKAATLYKKLYEQNPTNSYHYNNYYKTLVALKDFDGATKLVKKKLKKDKSSPYPYIDMGVLYKNQDILDKANEYFDKAIELLMPNYVRNTASRFIDIGQHDYAIAAYERGRKLKNDDKAFGMSLAKAYQKKGDIPKMMSSYLDYAVSEPRRVRSIYNALQKVVSNENHMEELQTQLYTRTQTEQNETIYPEFLIWTFLQQKNFEDAFIQARALDNKKGEDGQRIMELANKARAEKDYAAAILGYEYVINKNNALKRRAKVYLLSCRHEKITETLDYTEEDIKKLEAAYQSFLTDFGRNPNTVGSMHDLSHLYAFYLHDLNKAITISEEIVNMSGAREQIRAEAKLDLGDYYLMKNEVWEATLLYSQVDKAFKDDIIGEEARFRNARLAYYNGDFEWSQAQLNVLKAATSELIANDALELAIFITDNLGLDTSTTAMKMFARADLLIMQNKNEAAFKVFDSIQLMYPKHALGDDILFAKAKVALKKRKYETVVEHLENILADYGTDILSDDAAFMLAEMYENYLEDKEKAMNLYKGILTEHPSSLYVVEARKRFRKLRGDKVN